MLASSSTRVAEPSKRLETLRAQLSGELIGPQHPRYERVRRVWNGMVDRRPHVVAYCKTPEDIIRCVAFARETGALLAVRSGGHNITDASVCDGGFVIDLSAMNKVVVDPMSRTARAEGGALLRDLDMATQAHALATTTGVNSDTGLIELTLGGGIGRLGRKHGLSCDNLLSAEVVTADARLMSASASENEDLFWALRGGGGNFEIVTSATYRLHALGPTVLAGSLVYAWKDARDALRRYAEISIAAPDQICLDAALHTLPGGGHGFSISAFYAGAVSDGEKLLAPLRKTPTIADRIGPTRYVELQKAGDANFPHGRRYYWKAQFLREISEGLIDTLIERFPSVPSPTSLFVFQQVGGAIARVAPDATAFANRSAAYDAFPVSIWTALEEDRENMCWARETYEAARPFAMDAVYVNNLGDEGQDRVRAAYGANYDRLVQLKRKFDPGNLFRLNSNLAP